MVLPPHVFSYPQHAAAATLMSGSTVHSFLSQPHPGATLPGVPAASIPTSSVTTATMGTGVSPLATVPPGSAASNAASTTPAPRAKVHLRKAAGDVWSDPTLDEWDANDFRVFCGDLGNEVTDELLSSAFRQYKSFQRARVIRDKRTGKGRGYGFVSFQDPHDMLRALKEMDRKYVGNRPIRVMKSRWTEREVGSAQNKRINDAEITVPNNSKTLKKFKAMKPVTGGKKVIPAAPPVAGASALAPAGYRGSGGGSVYAFGGTGKTLSHRGMDHHR